MSSDTLNAIKPHTNKIISLDGDCNAKKDDCVVIIKNDSQLNTSEFVEQNRNKLNKSIIICKTEDVIHKSITAYGISGKSTEIALGLDAGWIQEEHEGHPDKFDSIRKTTVYCEPEELELAGEPIEEAISGSGYKIELDGIYEGLETNRQVIISGEKHPAKLATLSSVEYTTDNQHTIIALEEALDPLERHTVTIHGNVVQANHGETHQEVLGYGDGSKASQEFTLKQAPLSHISAPTPSGIASTLKIYVNDVRWHETDILADRQPTDRNFITTIDEKDITTVRFGDGKHGARLPTGAENITTEYRSGIGKAGNVRPGQLSSLVGGTPGVTEVINPLQASGGADKERVNQARKNAPLAVKVLDRLISVQDYQDFARTYAGIGKASAKELINGRQQIVHVTIAGADDIPIDKDSELFLNLRQALYTFGDPQQRAVLEIRTLLYLVLQAEIRILPDYQWDPVHAQLRQTLLERFSFAEQELGEDVLLSEVFKIMQAVPGVAYVDINLFGGIPEKITKEKPTKKGEDPPEKTLSQEKIEYALCLLGEQFGEVSKERFLTSEEILQAVQCKFPQPKDADAASPQEEEACGKYEKYKKCKPSENPKKTRQRVAVSLAAVKNGTLHPAQLALLNPDIANALKLEQIK